MRLEKAKLRSSGYHGPEGDGVAWIAYRRYPFYAVVREPEDSVVRVGYQGFGTGSNRDALRLGTGRYHGLKKGTRFWQRMPLERRLDDGVVSHNAWYKGVAR